MADSPDSTPAAALQEPATLFARAELVVIRGKTKEGTPKQVSFGPGVIPADKLSEEEQQHFAGHGVLFTPEQLMAASLKSE